MRSKINLVSLFLISAMAAAACSVDPPPTPVPAEPSTTGPVPATHPPRKLPAKAAVEKALLTPSEIGDGYTANPGMAEKNPAAGMNTSLTGCAEAAEDADAVSAHQVYQGGATGPFAVETITATQVDEAVALMRQLRKVRRNCHQFDGQIAGGMKLEITIDDLSIARVGEETVAYRLTATVPGVGAAFYAHLVTTRSGGLVVLITVMQMSSPEVAGTEEILRAALAKAKTTLD